MSKKTPEVIMRPSYIEVLGFLLIFPQLLNLAILAVRSQVNAGFPGTGSWGFGEYLQQYHNSTTAVCSVVALSLAGIAVGIGLYRGSQWSRWAILLLIVCHSPFSIATGNPWDASGPLIYALGALYLFYLHNRTVAYFSQER